MADEPKPAPKKSEDEKPADPPATESDKQTEEESTTKMGRPLKFESVAILQAKIDEYFALCDPHVESEVPFLSERANGEQFTRFRKIITPQKPYTIHGLARHLDTTRETLRDYESGRYDNTDLAAEVNADFSDTITRAKAKIAEFVEGQLYVSGASHGAQFNLKNNFGWKDESKLITENVSDDLDDLDRQSGAELAAVNRKKLAEAASEELGEDNGEARPKTAEPVVAADSPVQNQE